MSKRRVVVTGLGMLSPVGNTVESTWKALLAGQSGISLIAVSYTHLTLPTILRV